MSDADDVTNADYVTNENWVRTVGRPDAIDDIADQFERPAAAPSSLATRPAIVRWPRASQGWRSVGLWHPHSAERLHS